MGMLAKNFRGNFERDVLTLKSEDSQGQNRAVFRYPDDKSYTCRMDISPDGKELQKFMEGSYSKEN